MSDTHRRSGFVGVLGSEILCPCQEAFSDRHNGGLVQIVIQNPILLVEDRHNDRSFLSLF